MFSKEKINLVTKAISIITFSVFIALPAEINAQEVKKNDFEKIEYLQSENMDYMRKIYKIVEDYPAFAYSYDLEDGELRSVSVTGVEDELDKKRLEVYLFDLQSNKNMLKNKPNQIGVFYSVDDKAMYEDGSQELQDELGRSLEYPENAEDWGVEGTIFVKFVVDENGEIPFATTSTNIDSSADMFVEDLEQQAIDAIKETSGEWEPARVDGVKVPSLAVAPVTFDFQKNPALKTLIK